MNNIYDKSSLKTSFYRSMGSWKGVTSTLGFVTYQAAAPSRNNLIQCFQNRNLTVLVENIESHVRDFIQLLDDKARANAIVDGVVVFRLLALDIVTDVLWAEENRLLSSVDDTQAPALLRRFHAFSAWNATKSFIPGAEFVVKNFGTKKWKTLRDDCNDMDVTAREALQRWQEVEKGDKAGGHHDKDVLSMLQSMNTATAAPVPPEDVPAYMVEMLAAGSSTTSHTAAFACWLLSRDIAAQSRLRAELATTFPDLDAIDIRKAMDLPFLDGVIRETMRLYPMIPGPLERLITKPINMAGHVVPKGVVASTGAFNQGRLPDVYPDPDSWRPERWIDATERMKLNWTPFGHGCRSCPGSNLAMAELKYMIGLIFRMFQAVVPPGGKDDKLELADVFAAGTRSGHCWLKFQKS